MHILICRRINPKFPQLERPVLMTTTIRAGFLLYQNMIYVIRASDSNLVKIGYTKSNDTLKKRLASIRTSCPYKLRIEATMKGSKLKERCLHSFCISRHESGEWFRLTADEVIRMINKYQFWSPTQNGVENMSTISSKVRKKKKRYFK